jgi:hypothetical protein
MRGVLVVVALGVLLQPTPRYSLVQDGEPHGDPPYLLEDGWESVLNGTDLNGWNACGAGAKHEWYTTRFVMFERILSPTRLGGRAAPSGVILNGPAGKTANLCTERSFGDIELYLEFMLAKGSNSGVYLQGLYEIQIFDSWGSADPIETSDAGAIYHRWVDGQGVGGAAPLVNAARRPGEWQSYQVWFRAPRFDTAGRKTAPARFQRVLYNGLLVHKDVDAEGPTRAHLGNPRSGDEPADVAGRPRPGGVSEHSCAAAAAIDHSVSRGVRHSAEGVT